VSANRSRPAPAASRRHRQAVPCCGRGAVAGGYSVTVRQEGALRSCFPGDASPRQASARHGARFEQKTRRCSLEPMARDTWPAPPHARTQRQTPGPELSWVPLSIGQIRGLARPPRTASPGNPNRIIPEGIDSPVHTSGSTDTKTRTEQTSRQKGYSSGIPSVQASPKAK